MMGQSNFFINMFDSSRNNETHYRFHSEQRWQGHADARTHEPLRISLWTIFQYVTASNSPEPIS